MAIQTIGTDRNGHKLYQHGTTAPCTAYGLHDRYCCSRLPLKVGFETFAVWLARHHGSECPAEEIIGDAAQRLASLGHRPQEWGIPEWRLDEWRDGDGTECHSGSAEHTGVNCTMCTDSPGWFCYVDSIPCPACNPDS